jgi:hypothetical protein
MKPIFENNFPTVTCVAGASEQPWQEDDSLLGDILLCSLTEIDQRFRGVYCLHLHRPDDGSSKHL